MGRLILDSCNYHINFYLIHSLEPLKKKATEICWLLSINAIKWNMLPIFFSFLHTNWIR